MPPPPGQLRPWSNGIGLPRRERGYCKHKKEPVKAGDRHRCPGNTRRSHTPQASIGRFPAALLAFATAEMLTQKFPPALFFVRIIDSVVVSTRSSRQAQTATTGVLTANLLLLPGAEQAKGNHLCAGRSAANRRFRDHKAGSQPFPGTADTPSYPGRSIFLRILWQPTCRLG